MRLIFMLGLTAFVAFCLRNPSEPAGIGPIAFSNVAAQSGVRFTVRNSASPQKYLIETMIAGVAVFDYNDDGFPDLYFANGASVPDLKKQDQSFWNRLYRNNGNGTYTDVTAQSGTQGIGYATGVAAGDYDNDGHEDLFVAGVDRNILYRNRGDGTFADVTSQARLEPPPGSTKPWSVAAGWFDYDNDGKLDLFVVNYVRWDPAHERFCGDEAAGTRIYCHPEYYSGLANTLYHNNGDGTFTDVSKQSGIAASVGKGMGVAFGDYDHDGRLDVFVSNDTQPNFLFHNEGGGRFRDIAAQAGVAYNEDGRAISSMGVDFRDYDNDGREDLFISALENEVFPLFRNLGGGRFEDVARMTHLSRLTRHTTGWSDGLFDFNNDGFKDLFIASGDVQDNAEATSTRRSKQGNLVLANQHDGTFSDVSRNAGESFQAPGLHRGAAFGDLDGDGRVDAVVTRLNEPAEIFRNVSGETSHWLELRLIGHRSNRDGIGAFIHLTGASGREQWNRVTTSVGYGCSSDRTVHFGLGQDRTANLTIEWPSGAVQRLASVSVDKRVTIQEP